LDEIEYEYGKNKLFSAFSLLLISLEETVECYLDSILSNGKQQEMVDQRTSQWIDDIRSVNMRLIELKIIFIWYSFLLMFE
jgi:hypothetical protein